MFGKFGRVFLQPITNRQYARGAKGRFPLNAELLEVLPWWAAVLRSATERRTWFHGTRPIVVYVDAACCGHLGVVVYADGEQSVYSSHCPGWLAGADIYALEMRANLFGLAVAIEEFPGRAVLLCSDNLGATQTLIRGACRAATSGRMSAVFWNLAGTNATPVWIDEVAGKLNPPDPPSRDCVFCEGPFVASPKRCEVPNILHRILLNSNTLKESQFPITAGTRGFTPAWECVETHAETL